MIIRRIAISAAAACGAVVMASAATDVSAADRTNRADRALPASIEALRLAQPVTSTGNSVSRVEPALLSATGTQQVLVRLRTMPAARVDESLPADQVMQRERVRLEQSQFRNRTARNAPRARTLANVENVLNGVFMEVDAAQIPVLAADPAVERISRVVDYRLDLAETVPYVRQRTDGALPFTGRGVTVAVIDSGIDFTHAAFGSPGTPEFYQECYAQRDVAPTGQCAKFFGPRAPKVIGGYDFVGEAWPNGPLAPDPNPIDNGNAATGGTGHGTHVADIIAGRQGVARDARLVAIKACSAVGSSCSGIALIQALEFAVDPNGDGNFRDRVDIINMSLGAPYGRPFDDDLAFAVDSATALGVLTVASAGNSADKPYATGTPSAATTALAVAQTAVPSAVQPLMRILSPASIAGTFPAVFQPWSAPLSAAIEAPVQFGDGAGGNTLGCDPFAPGSLAGKIVLVDRGTCSFSVKAANVSAGGGLASIIGLVAPGDPFEGGFGGGDVTTPSYMVSQAVANRLRSGLPNTVVRFDPTEAIPLVMSMVGSSSRGPQHAPRHLIKPEIGAPGASVSAIAGSGSGTRAFGGTSGAAPMVAGAAAVVLEATGGTKTTPHGTPPGKAFGHGLRPIEVKALLMNNAEPNIRNDALTGTLAPITRIGAGELRVRDAAYAPVAAWDARGSQAALSFGFVDVSRDKVTLERTVRVRNYDNPGRSYRVTPTFRFKDDEDNGAVTVSAPKFVTVGPGRGRDTLFTVRLTIDGAKLRGNFMSSGSQGANPAALTTNEYDGYLVLDDGRHQLQLPWHVLPRKAARVVPSTTALVPGSLPQVIGLNNTGVGTAQNDVYALIATAPRLPIGGRGEEEPTPSIRAVGINTFPVPAGFCSAAPSFLWTFAVNTWVRQEHLLPVSHLLFLDTDRDGVDDFVVLNRDASGLGTISDGRQLSWVLNLRTGAANAFFFAEHSTNTGNTVLTICGEQIGMNAANLLNTRVNMDVIAQDFYFGGPGSEVTGLTVTPLGERFYGEANDVPGRTNDPQGLRAFDFDPFPGNSPELGLMLITNGDRGAGNRGGATKDTEALLLLAP